ncbi:MAG: ABC transporter substrate-binding protein [Beijerinckiaceae bacterium]
MAYGKWKKRTAALTWIAAASLYCGGAAAQLVVDGEQIAERALFEAAKKEGQLNLYGTWPPANQKILSDAFTKDTGIKISFVRATSGKLYPRVLAEFAAGRLGADFVDLTDLTFVLDLAKKGVLAVPHKTPSWDKIPASLKDSEGRWYTFMRLVQVIGVNTAIVKPGEEPKGFAELLDPKWKGRIGMPTIDAGGSAFSVQAFVREVVDKDYWKKMKAQEPRVYPSIAPTVTNLVRGEVHAILAGGSSIVAQMKRGAPVKVIFPSEGVPAFTLSGGVTKSARNPNAAKLYLNYITSKRGGSVIGTVGDYGTHPDAVPPKKSKRRLSAAKQALDGAWRSLREGTRSLQQGMAGDLRDQVSGSQIRNGYQSGRNEPWQEQLRRRRLRAPPFWLSPAERLVRNSSWTARRSRIKPCSMRRKKRAYSIFTAAVRPPTRRS